MANVLPIGMSNQRLDAFPLDSTSLHEDLAAAKAYAASPTAYAGQIIYVADARTAEEVAASKAAFEALFMIDKDKGLVLIKSEADVNVDDLKVKVDKAVKELEDLGLEVGDPAVEHADEVPAKHVKVDAPGEGVLKVVANGTLANADTEIEEKDVIGAVAGVGEYVKFVPGVPEVMAAPASGLHKAIEDAVKAMKDGELKDLDDRVTVLEDKVGDPAVAEVPAHYEKCNDGDEGALEVVAGGAVGDQVNEADVVGIAVAGDHVKLVAKVEAVPASGLFKEIDDLDTALQGQIDAINNEIGDPADPDASEGPKPASGLHKDIEDINKDIKDINDEIGDAKVEAVKEYQISADDDALTVVADDADPFDPATQIKLTDANAKAHAGTTFAVGNKVKLVEVAPKVPATGMYKYIDDAVAGVELSAKHIVAEDIEVTGIGQIGSVKDGDTIAEGTTITDVLKMLLRKAVPAVYTQPAATITLTPAAGDIEVGATINPVIAYTFTQNDAGAETGVAYGPLDNATQAALVMDEADHEYSVTVSFAQGAQKVDNFGEPSGDPIAAGSVTAKAKYTPFRKMFTVADAGIVAPATADDVKAMTAVKFANDVTIDVPANSQRVVVAVPKGKTMKSAKYVEQGNAEYVANFNATEVAGVGLDGKEYTVYTYVFAIPCAAKMTFKITLA